MKKRNKIILGVVMAITVLSSMILPILANSYSDLQYFPKTIIGSPFSNILNGRTTLVVKERTVGTKVKYAYVYDLTDASASPPISFWISIRDYPQQERYAMSTQYIAVSKVGTTAIDDEYRLYVESHWRYLGNYELERIIRIPMGGDVPDSAGVCINKDNDFFMSDITIIREDFYVTQEDKYDAQHGIVDTDNYFMTVEYDHIPNGPTIADLKEQSDNEVMPCFRDGFNSFEYYRKIIDNNMVSGGGQVGKRNTPCIIDGQSLKYYIPKVDNIVDRTEGYESYEALPIAKWYYSETQLPDLYASIEHITFSNKFYIESLSINGDTPYIYAEPRNDWKEKTFDSNITNKTVTHPTYETINVGESFTSWITTAVNGFMRFEPIPNIALGDVLSIIVSISLFLYILKLFAGG